jgi:4-amino-4-deoxy-L-arabinose transferase-like glycosyltransferase
MLGTSLAFLVGGQYVNHDMLVAAWISAAIWCLGLAFMLGGEAPDKCWARWGMVCCAFGFLSKGLIGLVLPGGVIFFWLLATSQWRKMLRFPWLSGFALFALIALPWFVLVEREHPGMFAYMFGHHQVSRFGGTTFNNVRPWWFYGVCLLVLMCPWAFFALRTAWGDAKGGLLRSGDVTQQARLLCWIWLLLILVFFSIPSSKIIGYVLPVMPALAVLSALGWTQTVGSKRWQGAALVAVGVLAMGFGVVATVMSARYTERKDGSRDVAMKLACLAAPQDKVFALGEFPYDAPFYTRAQSAMRVIQDWDSLRKNSGDNWRRELFEGADFDAAAGVVLQTQAQLTAAAAEPGNWALAKDSSTDAQALSGWTLAFKGQAWSLYRSGSGAESPKTAEHKGLNRCQN